MDLILKREKSQNPMLRAFGKAVRARRKQLEISQTDLARRAGLHRTYVTNVERGVCNVSLETIAKLARALDTTLASILEQVDRAAESPARSRPARMTEAPVDILLVEDNPADAERTVRTLKSSGLANTVHVARDGAEALDYVFARVNGLGAVEQRPRLILLDLNLPKVSGLEVLQVLKSDPRTSTIAVVVLTASPEGRPVSERRRLGADAYLVKPVSIGGLCEIAPQLRLNLLLLQRSGRAGGAKTGRMNSARST